MKIKTVVHEAEEGAIGPKSPPFRAALPKVDSMDELMRNLREAIEGCLA